MALFVVPLAMATVVGYGQPEFASALAAHANGASEPVALLLSGGILLGLAVALRRMAA